MRHRCALLALLTLTTSLGGCSIHWWGDDHDHHHHRPWYQWDNGRHEGYDRRYEGGHDDHDRKGQHEDHDKSKAKGSGKSGGKGNGRN